MPSTSKAQQRFFYAELARAQSGQGTKTGMNLRQIIEFTKIKPKKKGDK